jgi:hypothetical protein
VTAPNGVPFDLEEGVALQEEVAELREKVDRLALMLAKLAIATRNADVLSVEIAANVADGSLRK